MHYLPCLVTYAKASDAACKHVKRLLTGRLGEVCGPMSLIWYWETFAATSQVVKRNEKSAATHPHPLPQVSHGSLKSSLLKVDDSTESEERRDCICIVCRHVSVYLRQTRANMGQLWCDLRRKARRDETRNHIRDDTNWKRLRITIRWDEWEKWVLLN